MLSTLFLYFFLHSPRLEFTLNGPVLEQRLFSSLASFKGGIFFLKKGGNFTFYVGILAYLPFTEISFFICKCRRSGGWNLICFELETFWRKFFLFNISFWLNFWNECLKIDFKKKLFCCHKYSRPFSSSTFLLHKIENFLGKRIFQSLEFFVK